jgi:hypothetical protein
MRFPGLIARLTSESGVSAAALVPQSNAAKDFSTSVANGTAFFHS